MGTTPRLVSTGCTGLDDILNGGLPPFRQYLLHGSPGVGKSTLSMQFLMEGVKQGERCLYLALSESEDELRDTAKSHGWSLDGITIRDLASIGTLDADENTLFHHSEVELSETVSRLTEAVEKVKPTRVVLDSLSELRLLAGESLRHRRQVLGLKQYFMGRRCTVLLLDDRNKAGDDTQSIAHGVIELEQLTPTYGGERRRVRITKLRGVRFRGGFHDLRIDTGGVKIFPRLVAAEHHQRFDRHVVPSGLAELDGLLDGGLDRGTSTLFIGPAGSGKSSLAMQYVAAATGRGEKAAMFVFDEGLGTVNARAQALGIDLQPLLADGRLLLKQIDPAELSPGELAHSIRRAVEEDGVRMIVIDSLNGYLNSMPEERFLLIHLHEVLSYLRQRGVTTLMVVAQHGLVGANMGAPIDVSYLADTVVLLRYFEAGGQMRKALSVMKKRSGKHDSAIREFMMTSTGIRIGDVLREFRGILTGVPKQEPSASNGGMAFGAGK
jgi:circadian clock protein KaiC